MSALVEDSLLMCGMESRIKVSALVNVSSLMCEGNQIGKVSKHSGGLVTELWEQDVRSAPRLTVRQVLSPHPGRVHVQLPCAGYP